MVEFGRQDVDFGVLVIQRRTNHCKVAVLSGFEPISAIFEIVIERFCYCLSIFAADLAYVRLTYGKDGT